MTVLDGVGNGFSGRDQDVISLIRTDARSSQPAAQGSADAVELVDVCGELHLQRRGMAVEQKDDVVLIAAAGRETGHDLIRQIIECAVTAVLDKGGDASDAVVQ